MNNNYKPPSWFNNNFDLRQAFERWFLRRDGAGNINITALANRIFDIIYNVDDANAPVIRTRKIRGTSIVQDGDVITQLIGQGYDGVDYEPVAHISFEIDGTPGENDMPGRIVFKVTKDGEGALTEAGRIGSDLILNFNANGIRTMQDVSDVSDPPTDAQLDSAFGTPAALGRGFVATVDDNDADTDCYIAWTSDTSWFYLKGTKAT